MRIRQHKESGLWCREDGAVLIPAYRNSIDPILRKFHWTYGSKNKKGYLLVFFRGKAYRVHRLVAETYLPNPAGYPTVDHKNRVKTANFVENLQWASYKMQNDNTKSVDLSVARYGVRYCQDRNAYDRARYTNNHEAAEQMRARSREWKDRQRALGKHRHKCPDGKERYLTDEDFQKLKDGLK